MTTEIERLGKFVTEWRKLPARDGMIYELHPGDERHAVCLVADIERLASENEALRQAWSRQCDNMAFILNHAIVAGPWYDKFKAELEEDRAALSKKGEGA